MESKYPNISLEKLIDKFDSMHDNASKFLKKMSE